MKLMASGGQRSTRPLIATITLKCTRNLEIQIPECTYAVHVGSYHLCCPKP